MKSSEIIYNRLEILEALEIMGSDPEKIYDDITALAASICNSEISLITLLDDKKQFFKSRHRVDIKETQLEVSFCKYLITEDVDQLIVEDAKKDARFSNNTLVVNSPYISFYAGISLKWSNGTRLGSLCVLDPEPKKLSDQQIKGLETLAQQVIHLLELRQAKKDVDKKKGELEKILNSSLDIICTIDRNGTFLSVNNASKNIWGYCPSELIGRNYMDFVYEKDRQKTEISSKATFSGKETLNFENRYVHKNGSLVSVLWSANWDEQDKTMYCIARDITEKKKVSEHLEHSERRFKTLVQEGSDLIAILDNEANYKYVSPTSTKILQITPEEFIGKNAFDFIHPDDQASVYNRFKEILEKSQVTIDPFRFKNKNNEWRWVETIATNQMDEPALNGIVANSRDVTERVLYLKAIEEQNKRLKEIAWTQSHIFRAPVARIMGLIELIKDHDLTLKEKEEILDFIVKSAQEIDSIIKDIVENSFYNIKSNNSITKDDY
ncbi:PAS domain S-box protein [Maribacter flavus]|uniref:PAS domain S-box protein n=1 Tax=Maribacter flavus TaxID=1658664 RepID=A0A5B2U0L8_9FLAO|nr:PAS domain S-box protein [Maribacter flavus]KAA2219520.1 PAS domain S-box protein [Maribacter flavus]